MFPGPGRTVALALAAGLVSGCAGPGPLARRHTMVGTLKANVAQLETEKDEYRKKVAELETENRRITDQLTQEREANGELTARLDDARNLLNRQGLNPGNATASATAPSVDWPAKSSPASPASNKARPGRKPPFAQIGGGLKAVPYPESGDEAPPPASSSSDSAAPKFPALDPGPQSQNVTPLHWLPVADGNVQPTSKR